MFSAKEILAMAVKIEKNGEKIYREAVQEINHPQLIELLEWMAEEEARHAEWFADMRLKWDPEHDNPLADEMSHQLFSEVIGDQGFSLNEVDFNAIRSTKQLVRLFIEFEYDSILFYELIQPFTKTDETKQLLKRIILEEHRHIDKLKEIINTDTETVANSTELS